jgi:esterase
MIHGIGDGAFVWDTVTDHLASDVAGISLDLRGHGDSPRDGAGCYGLEAHITDVATLLQKLDLSRITLVGHSLGAEIAIRVAGIEAQRVTRLIMVDGGPDLLERPVAALREELAALVRPYASVDEFRTHIARRRPCATADMVHRYASSALRPLAGGSYEVKFDPAIQHDLPVRDNPSMWSVLETTPFPKLLIRGSASSFLPAPLAMRIAERAKACRLVTVRAAGHAVALDNPAGLHAAIKAFLSAQRHE